MVVLGIVIARAMSIPVVALSQRWIVDATGSVVGVVAAALVGAVAYAASASGGRIQLTMRDVITDRVRLVLDEEVLDAATRMPTLDQVERSDYQDRIALTLNGTEALASGLWIAVETATAVLGLLFSIVLLASVDGLLAYLALLCLPPLLIARTGQRIIARAEEASAYSFRRADAYHRLCIDPRTAKEVLVSNNIGLLDGVADGLWRDAVATTLKARFRAMYFQLLGWGVFAAGFAVALVIVTNHVADGSASLGDVVLVISLCTRLRGQMSFSVQLLSDFSSSVTAADHLVWLQAQADEDPLRGDQPPDAFSAGVTFVDVTYKYPGAAVPALTNLNLTIPAGTVLGIVGLNGAGKSTFVDLLTGNRRPTHGTIVVDGRPLSDLAPALWLQQNAATFQDFAKFEFLLRESVGTGDVSRLQDERAIESAIRRAGASNMLEGSLTLGTQLGPRFGGVDLSHGQWQRVALARCLMRDRPLILTIDEPSAALDPETEYVMFQRIEKIARELGARTGSITVLVTHRFSAVGMADMIVVLDERTIKESGSHAELLAANGLYARLYRAQAEGYA